MEPPPKRQRLDPLPQKVPLQRTITDAFRNDSSSSFDGAGISNPKGRIDVGRDVNIFSNVAPLPTDANDTRKDLLESLRFDQIDARHDSIKKAYSKTCRWFLDTDVYKKWEETGSSHANNFLWIKGKPGAGKSTLMKFLHGQIRARTRRKNSNEILISFFFNARGHQLEKSTFGLYRSLLWQLLDKRPNLQQVLDELRPGYHWTSECLKSLLDDAIQELGETPIFCLIDALDECDQDEVRDMVLFLEALVDAQSSVHVCFASRHYPHITVQTSLDIILEERDGHEQDIAMYLTSALRIKPKELADQIRAEMQEKAHGVFIWVVLVVDILNKEYDAGRKYRLRERLQELPGDLHLLFRDILTRDTNNRAGLLLCIQWVLFAKEPLTPRQLHLAILSGTEPEFLSRCHFEPYPEDDLQRYILDNSKGLAQSTRSKIPTVQFIHESVRDFLLKGNGLGELFNGPEPNIHGESHEALKNCCLTYLGMEPFVELDQYSYNEAIEVLPFLEYAHSGVLHHADKAAQSGIGQEHFLSTFPRSQWVEQHNLLEKAELRRYTPNVSLLYILAEAGLSELIRAHSCRQSCFEIEGERYGVPILAALALKHEIAVQRMLELQAERYPSFDFADFCKRTQLFDDSISHCLSRSYKFPRKRELLWELITHTEDRISLFFLETTVECSGYTATTSDELFLLACECKRFESAKFLVQHCNNITNADGVNTPLHQVSGNGILEMTKFLVNHGTDLSATDMYGETPLHKAIHNGHCEVAQLLFKHGADISAADKHDNTLLHNAIQNSHFDIAQLLIDRGADISAADQYGDTLLHKAVNHNHYEGARLLLINGADISAVDQFGNTLLHKAVNRNHDKLAQLLLNYGADISATDRFGKTLLHKAVKHNYYTVAQLLLNYGADIPAADQFGNTLLHEAVNRNHDKLAQLLLDHGADISATCGFGKTLLHEAVKHNYYKESQLLLNYGADISAADQFGNTPLHDAIYHQSFGVDIRVAQLLLDNGADISATNKNGNTPLHIAACRGRFRVAQLLIDHGANTSAANEQGVTPLHWACHNTYGNNHAGIAALLIDHGANPSATTETGETPLHRLLLAKRLGYFRDENLGTAEALVASGADISAPDGNGRTPLQIALDRGLRAIANFLQSCGSESSAADPRH